MRRINKNLSLVAILSIVVTVFIATDLFAQEEGFFKRFLKRFEKKEEADVSREVPKEKGAIPEAKGKAEIEEQAEVVEDLTRGELLKRIREMLDSRPKALDYIPGLKVDEDRRGNRFYTYKPEAGITKKLDQLNRKTLINIYKRIRSEVNRLNVERITKQLDLIRQAQDATKRAPQAPRVVTPNIPPSVPQVPSTYTVPAKPPTTAAPPRTVTPPSGPPSIPTTPSTPPRR